MQETKGLILFVRKYRERDQLVKIFTEKYGKIMFFVKNALRPNHPVRAGILPFTEAVYIGNIRAEGLSFLNEAKDVTPFFTIQEDIFVNAYATYLLNLVDVAIEDRVYDPALYGFTRQALQLLNEGKDPEIVTNIFEVQILQRFGVAFQWEHCAICGKTEGKFDFSSQYHGIICSDHFEEVRQRYHASPRAIHFIRLFSNLSLEQIHSIQLKEETKREIRQVIDALYDEFVGIHLKSKKFIDQMQDWGSILKKKE